LIFGLAGEEDIVGVGGRLNWHHVNVLIFSAAKLLQNRLAII